MSNVGHCNPAVVKAVQEQAARYMHVMVYGELVETPQVEYAAKVASLLSGGLSSLYFVNSGAKRSKGRSSWPNAIPDARSWSPCGVPTTGRPTGR